MDFEKDYLDNETSDENIEDLNKDEPFDEKELKLETEKEEPEEQSKGGTKSANDPEPVYFEKFDDALVSDGQGGYTNLGEAVYAKDSGGRTEINELRNLVDNTDGTVHYKGTTTTPISNGSTTNPITIDGEEYTAVFGDIVVYGYTEFVFDGTTWSEFGRPFDTTPTSGSANAVTSDGIYAFTNPYRTWSRGSGAGSVQTGTHDSSTGASGTNSLACGYKTIANQNAMVAIGAYNSVRSGDRFVIGNGASGAMRSNIVEVNSTELNVNGEIKKNGVSLPTPYTTMPTITAAMLGQIAQYVGETTNDYVKGYFYIASSDGAAEPTYSWVSMVDSTPTSGSKNFVTSDGIAALIHRGTGNNSTIMSKNDNTATHPYAMSVGYQTKATQQCAFAEGYKTTASGVYSHSENYLTLASGSYSSASGTSTIASQTSMTAIGQYNSPNNGDLFNIGNGTANNARSNIVEVNSTEMNVNGTIRRDGVGIDDYTTTERKIGKWIDGSDLYQRTFEVTGLVNGQWNTSVLGTSGINIVDTPSGTIHWLDSGEPGVVTSLNFYRNSTTYATTFINATNDLDIFPNIEDSITTIDKAVITIKYTKPSVQANLMQTAPTEEISETPTVEEDDMR